jgi:hypothetical protein
MYISSSCLNSLQKGLWLGSPEKGSWVWSKALRAERIALLCAWWPGLWGGCRKGAAAELYAGAWLWLDW